MDEEEESITQYLDHGLSAATKSAHQVWALFSLLVTSLILHLSGALSSRWRLTAFPHSEVLNAGDIHLTTILFTAFGRRLSC